ncbi:Zinc finger CCCH domain-containing protein 50 [Hondaea fermentalgiana]|uniref:Zinc finger CCCH domain-containing protein 50 n=1 Tax=Hondaea fermentalgiana TaxID=2315210 RepID=A0A2R5G3E7_9STRA|nr:Zinc finger CCCH domain-containing protein 50 [Hondaea fermentalgiana]|eukprot:GBG25055.1 Zinc finger CCCH domain-containing protein 50 [Hondaea fermentalgiana]
MTDFVRVQRRGAKKRQAAKPQGLSENELKGLYLKMVNDYKTQLCKEGSCKEKKCFDAHTEQELRRPLYDADGKAAYSREMCPHKFPHDRNCPEGRKCKFSHNNHETMYHPRTYKTRPCKHRTKCDRGKFCAFMHDEDILTPKLRHELFFRSEAMEPFVPEVRPKSKVAQANEAAWAAQNAEVAEKFSAPPDFSSVQQPSAATSALASASSSFRDKALANAGGFAAATSADAPSSSLLAPTLSSSSAGGAYLFPHLFSQRGSLMSADPFGNGLRAGGFSTTPTSGLPSASSLTGTSVDPARVQFSTTRVLQLISPMQGLDESMRAAILDVLASSNMGAQVTDAEGNSALSYAIEMGMVDLIPALASVQTVNLRNLAGQTPLLLALRGDNLHALKALLQAGASVNEGTGLLHKAIQFKAMQCSSYLASLFASFCLEDGELSDDDSQYQHDGARERENSGGGNMNHGDDDRNNCFQDNNNNNNDEFEEGGRMTRLGATRGIGEERRRESQQDQVVEMCTHEQGGGLLRRDLSNSDETLEQIVAEHTKGVVRIAKSKISEIRDIEAILFHYRGPNYSIVVQSGSSNKEKIHIPKRPHSRFKLALEELCKNFKAARTDLPDCKVFQKVWNRALKAEKSDFRVQVQDAESKPSKSFRIEFKVIVPSQNSSSSSGNSPAPQIRSNIDRAATISLPSTTPTRRESGRVDPSLSNKTLQKDQNRELKHKLEQEEDAHTATKKRLQEVNHQHEEDKYELRMRILDLEDKVRHLQRQNEN